MSTRYTVFITRWTEQDDESSLGEVIANVSKAPGYEVAPMLKELAKKLHESPPPVVLEGQQELM